MAFASWPAGFEVSADHLLHFLRYRIHRHVCHSSVIGECQCSPYSAETIRLDGHLEVNRKVRGRPGAFGTRHFSASRTIIPFCWRPFSVMRGVGP